MTDEDIERYLKVNFDALGPEGQLAVAGIYVDWQRVLGLRDIARELARLTSFVANPGAISSTPALPFPVWTARPTTT